MNTFARYIIDVIEAIQKDWVTSYSRVAPLRQLPGCPASFKNSSYGATNALFALAWCGKRIRKDQFTQGRGDESQKTLLEYEGIFLLHGKRLRNPIYKTLM